MMEWCTDVVVSSSSFLSLSLGSSFFWIPKQSVQSSKIKPQQVQRFTLWPFPSSVWELNHKNTKQGKNARCTWVSAFLSVKRYLLIFYHLIPHLAQSLRRERPLTTRDRKPFLKSYEFTSLFFISVTVSETPKETPAVITRHHRARANSEAGSPSRICLFAL